MVVGRCLHSLGGPPPYNQGHILQILLSSPLVTTVQYTTESWDLAQKIHNDLPSLTNPTSLLCGPGATKQTTYTALMKYFIIALYDYIPPYTHIHEFDRQYFHKGRDLGMF
mgnify:CR=1 FL=1